MGRNPQPVLQVVGGFICLAVGKPVTSLPLAWPVTNLRIFHSACPAAWFSLLKQFSRTDYFVLYCGGLVQILIKTKSFQQGEHFVLMFYYRDDSYATARISNGSRHAVQHARHDGNELWLSDASWTHGHAGVCWWDVAWNETFLLLWFYVLTAEVAHCVVWAPCKLIQAVLVTSSLRSFSLCNSDAEVSRTACKCKWQFIDFLFKNPCCREQAIEEQCAALPHMSSFPICPTSSVTLLVFPCLKQLCLYLYCC